MNFCIKLFRFFYINYVLLVYGFDNFVLGYSVLPLRLLSYCLPAKWHYRKYPRGVRIRLACEKLGPIFVKFGQLLSTRLDILPEDIALELVKLQDRVPPFASVKAENIIRSQYTEPLEQLFTTVDFEPLASASIAQVHAATLLDGKEVVIKILRPKVKKKILLDIAIMFNIATIATKCLPTLKRFRPADVVLEFKKTILDELDLQREAANASQLRRNFQNSSLLYVPEIHWPLSKTNILVMERIYGTPVSDIKTLQQNQVDLKQLAEKGVRIFFTQVFEHCFFHADMHPGNVWVDTNQLNDAKYLALDFGIMGTLGPHDQHYLAENFLAFFKRDYRRVAELHVESGWVPRNTRVDEFEAAIRCVCEPIFEKPLKEISFGKTLLKLFQVAKRFHMEIQPQLVLLQKTLISVEGLGRQLYPDLDLWTTARPFLERWMQKRISLKSLVTKAYKHAPFWLEKLPEIPNLLFNSLKANANIAVETNPKKSIITGNKNEILFYSMGILTGVAVAAAIFAIMGLVM